MMLSERARVKAQSILTIAALILFYLLYVKSGVRDQFTLDHTGELASSATTAILIIVAMTGAWAFALPASIFFFVTPLLFPILPSTIIICVGSALGTTAGYVAARYVGGPWIERFREHRVTTFLQRHSSFASLFAVRVFPSSPREIKSLYQIYSVTHIHNISRGELENVQRLTFCTPREVACPDTSSDSADLVRHAR